MNEFKMKSKCNLKIWWNYKIICPRKHSHQCHCLCMLQVMLTTRLICLHFTLDGSKLLNMKHMLLSCMWCVSIPVVCC